MVDTGTGPRNGQRTNRGSISHRCETFLFSSKRTDRVWGPLNRLFNGFRQRFTPGLKRGGGGGGGKDGHSDVI